MGTYGANEVGYWGEYVFLYMEINGAQIPEDAVVTTWATIEDPDDRGTVKTETVECVMTFRSSADSFGPREPELEEITTRTYQGTIEAAGTTLESWSVG